MPNSDPGGSGDLFNELRQSGFVVDDEVPPTHIAPQRDTDDVRPA